MEHVGVRDFRDRATRYLKGGDPLAIERHGEVIRAASPVHGREVRVEVVDPVFYDRENARVRG